MQILRRAMLIIAVASGILGLSASALAACNWKANLNHTFTLGTDYTTECSGGQPCGQTAYFTIQVRTPFSCIAGASNEQCITNGSAVLTYTKTMICHPGGACIVPPGSGTPTSWGSRLDTMPCP